MRLLAVFVIAVLVPAPASAQSVCFDDDRIYEGFCLDADERELGQYELEKQLGDFFDREEAVAERVRWDFIDCLAARAAESDTALRVPAALRQQ